MLQFLPPKNGGDLHTILPVLQSLRQSFCDGTILEAYEIRLESLSIIPRRWN